MASLFRPIVTRYVLGGRRVAKGTPGAVKVRERSKKWWGKYRDADGILRPVALSPNKTVAAQMLRDIQDKVERSKVGWVDPYEAHKLRPLLDHLTDFEQELRTQVRRGRRRPPTPKQVALKVGRIRRIITECGFATLTDIALEPVQEFLSRLSSGSAPAGELDAEKEFFTRDEVAELLDIKPASVSPLVRRHGLEAEGNGRARRFPRQTVAVLLSRTARGLGVSTAGYYAREIKAFTKWLTKRKRMADDPLAALEGATSVSDHRHDRRPLTEDELRRVLEAAQSSPVVFRDLDGEDRHHLYLTALSTGFRAGELASLVPSDFALDQEPATVTLDGSRTKNGETAVQPLPSDVANALRSYLAGRPAKHPVWAGSWPDRAAEMLRIDLDAAGVPYVQDGADGPLFADFHALRHTFIGMLDKTGVTLKEAMHLARHSDPKLTMRRYGRPQLHDVAQAVERLPSLVTPSPERDTLRATGTDGSILVAPMVAPTPDKACSAVRLPETREGGGSENAAGRNPLILQGVEAGCDAVIGGERSSGGWDRTTDTRLMKPLL